MITPSDFSASTATDQQIIERVRELSPFFRRMLDADASREAQLISGLRQPFSASAMSDLLGGHNVSDEASLKTALRKLRQAVMLRVIARDLGGLADYFEVAETMSLLAETAINFALHYLALWQQEIHGTPMGESATAQPFIVVGMGKLGGRELNASSDIDLIFAYPEDGETTGPSKTTNHNYFANLGKKLIAAIGEITADGLVFRVDMLLRPYGGSGPLVGSFAMLEEYYQTQGREWERYAWIKGRVIAGPEKELQDMLRPFVFRKYLDYGALASMRSLKAQIIQDVNRRDKQEDVKLGPGGIREIEFIAQVFQLIRGGRDTALQIRPTLQVLKLVEERGLLPWETVEELSTAYVFLRNVEHRLQYLEDAQTQMLPGDDENRQRIASGMGFDSWDAFYAVLNEHRTLVESHFSAVFSMQDGDQPKQRSSPLAAIWLENLADERIEQELVQHGYAHPTDVRQQLHGVRQSARYQQLPALSRERFDALMPQVLLLAGEAANPNATLSRALTLLEAICRRASYLALLAEFPQALQLVIKLVAASPWLATYLTQHPILLDELLDTRNLYAAPDFTTLKADLKQRMQECAGDVERQMDAMRHFKHANMFRLAAQDIAGQLTLETLSDHLTALAEIILGEVLATIWPTVRGKHRDTPQFAVIGYGKLGGKEMGYSSDLDIVFLYDDDASEASEVYARFGQRINSWLNSITAAGQLYETDLQLRPDGASGLLVSSVAAFSEYQKNKAWTWEHQALTRARFCAGDASIGEAFETLRRDILQQPRDLAKLKEDILAMRDKMLKGFPNNTELFDLKHDRGGLIDVEFAVQYLVLAHAAQHPELTDNIGNIALLHRCGELGLLPMEVAHAAADAYRTLRQAQHAIKLQGADKPRVPGEEFVTVRAAAQALWAATLG